MQVRFNRESGPEQRAIKISKTPFRRISALAEVFGQDIDREVQIYTGLSHDDIQSLEDASLIAILREGRRLNGGALSEHFSLQRDMLKVMRGGDKFDEQILQLAKSMAESSKPSNS